MSSSKKNGDVQGTRNAKSLHRKGNGSFASNELKRGALITCSDLGVPIFSAPSDVKPIDVYTQFLNFRSKNESNLTYENLSYNVNVRDKYHHQLQNGEIRDLAKRAMKRKISFLTDDPLLEAATVLAKFHSNIVPEASARSRNMSDVLAGISHINHSCVPNAKLSWDPAENVYTLYAIMPIHEGQEICVSYIDPMKTYTKRKEALEEWSPGFRCLCKACASMEDDQPEQVACEIDLTRREFWTHRSLLKRTNMDLECLYNAMIKGLDKPCMVEMIEYKVEAYEGLANEQIRDKRPTGHSPRPITAAESLGWAIYFAEICFGKGGSKRKELKKRLKDWEEPYPQLRQAPKNAPSSVHGQARGPDAPPGFPRGGDDPLFAKNF